MDKIKLTFNELSQISSYFKTLENSAILTFSQRRKIMPLNKKLEEQMEILNKQVEILVEKYGEKDESGKPIQLKNGGYKIKEEDVLVCNREFEELATTELEIDYDPFKLPENYFDNFKCDIAAFELINNYFIEKK